MVIYVFHAILKLSHLLLSLLCPQVCSLCLCLYYCPAKHHYHFSIFHIFVLIYNIHVSLSDLFHFVYQALTLVRMAIIKKQYMLERM